MPLTPPMPRRPMHARTVQCDGYRRDDGLWDIDASIVDRKPFRYTEPYRGVREPGSDVHHMAIRLTIGDDLVVRAIEVDMPSTPYAACVGAAPRFQGLVGKRIDKGWRRTVRDVVGAEQGCTHARELLFPMATTAFQTVFGWSEDDAHPGARASAEERNRPSFVGGCIAWALDGPVVARFYPALSRRREPT